jgi:RNA polymerase sigma-70 factor (ECF subfamily)
MAEHSPESLLLERWRDGDERAAERLYNYYRDSTFRLAYGVLGNSEDAEEAAQDALTYALVNIHNYNVERGSFSTWLHTITVSRCRDRQRRKRLPLVALAEWLGFGRDIATPMPGPEQHAIQAETHSAVWHAVQSDSPILREAVRLRYWADHTYREIGEILGCPVPTAQSRVRLAYKQLRQSLASRQITEFTEALR